MDELKPCPFCGGNKLERWTVKELGYAVIECTDCHGKVVRGLDSDVIAAWNRRTEPGNKPLTLEQLRQMDGEPVWIESDVYHEHNWNIVTSCSEKSIQFASADSIIYRQNNEYGTNWLAYAHKPEHEAKP